MLFLWRFPSFLLLLLLLVFPFFGNCKANETLTCRPSSCGNIRNISCPFRLETDPLNCGDSWYELTCENNRAVLHTGFGKLYVEAINYDNLSMQVTDAGIIKDNCSSMPLVDLSSLSYSWLPQYSEEVEYAAAYDYPNYWRYLQYYINMATHEVATFISCPFPLNDTVLVGTAPCNTSRGSYVVYGAFTAADMEDSCSIEVTTLVSKPGREIKNMSSLSIHNAMANGFWFSWSSGAYCCNESGECDFGSGDGIFSNGCSGPKIPFFSRSLCLRNLWQNIQNVLEFIRDSLPYVIKTNLALRLICAIPCILFLAYKYRRRHLSMYDNIEQFLQSQNRIMPIRYSYFQIWMMTKGFRNKLGEGGYGSVYKGVLSSSSDVAVKKLGKAKGNGQDFINEVGTIGRIHHVNVVRLVGFCAENSNRAIVYDFMPNGSLEKYIFGREDKISIACQKMYDISLGVARGIEYLHRGCDMQILHFDIKPHNILLDENFVPKISDFGLAKLYQANDSIVSLTAARGTMGYMAPELFYKNIGGVSHKADVYSYGMLLMEMASRRKNLNAFEEHPSEIYFPSWVYEQFQKGKEIEMGDVAEERTIVKKMIIVALWCIQMKPEDRPTMHKVVEMLEGTLEALQMPPKPFLSPQELPRES